jgi:hypothetical protein
MISAFKHLRLSGYNLTPVANDGSSTLRLGFGNSGLAYYSELTGISGYLMSQINVANADVNNLNNLQGNVYITGQDGIRIEVDAGLGEIKIVGNSGYFQALTDSLSNSLSARLNQSGTYYIDTFATKTSLAQTGEALTNYNTAYSGWANAQFVAKSSNQVFTRTLAPGLDAYAIIYPVAFASTPKIQATLEVPGEVMYNLSVRSVGQNGYTGVLSDNIAESPVYIHTFASTQN